MAEVLDAFSERAAEPLEPIDVDCVAFIDGVVENVVCLVEPIEPSNRFTQEVDGVIQQPLRSE